MIIYGISFLVGGIILLIFSILLCFGFVNLLHDYHRNNVKEVDKKKFGLSVGLSLAITAISMTSIGIISLIIRKEFIIIWTLVAFAISFAISTVLLVIFIRKYNGSLFGN